MFMTLKGSRKPRRCVTLEWSYMWNGVHHHHYAAVVSRGWAKASACRLQITLSCAFLCHIVSLQYVSRSSLHRLAGLPCRLFLSYGLQVVTREVHRSSLRRLICHAQDHFIFSYSVDYIYDFWGCFGLKAAAARISTSWPLRCC